MVVYIPFVVFTSIGALTRNKKWVYRIALAILFLISAFRSESFGGSDAYFYQVFFRTIPTISGLSRDFLANAAYGPGFVLLTSLAKTIHNDFLFFQVLVSFISIALLHEVIKRVPEDKSDYTLRLQFLVCYFCYRFIYNDWISIRQNIANLIIWIVLLSVDRKADKRKIIKLVLLIVVASMFHSTAIINIILFPLILLLKRVSHKKKILIVIPASLVLMLFSNTIFTNVLNVFTQYIDDRYVHYSIGVGGNIVNFIVRIVCLYLMYLNFDEIEDEKKHVMFDSLLAMSLIGSINVAIVYRFYEYFGIGLYYTLANVPKMFRKNNGYYLAYFFLVVAVFIVLLRFCFTMDSGLYLHYHFYNR